MFEIDKPKLLEQYVIANIIILLNYNLFCGEIPFISIVPIQLLLSLNLIAVGLYALFKDNIVLISSNNFEKTTVISIVTQYAPVWELLKFILSSERKASDYTTEVYLLSILFHTLLNETYPQFFDKFRKFNFGFSILYFALIVLNIQVNMLIPCTILGILATYVPFLTLNYMAIATSNVIYSIVFIEGLFPLIIILSSSKDKASALFGFLIGGIVTFVIYLVAVILQLRKTKSTIEDGINVIKNDDDIENGSIVVSQAHNANSNKYSTFSN